MKLVTMTNLLVKRFGIEKALEMIKTVGFDGYDCSIFEDDWESVWNAKNWLTYTKSIAKKAQELALPCLQAHAPCPMVPGVVPLDEYLEMSIRALEVCYELECPTVVVHPVCKYTAQENFDELYSKLLPIAQKLGVTIATENMFKWKDRTWTETVPAACGTASDFVEHVDIANSKYLTACLDLGHAQMVNCEGAVALIKALGKRIGALHVHDNDLYHDDHIFPFAGKSNWEEITSALAEIGYDGHFTFEADSFMRRYPDELMGSCLQLLHDTGRYLIKRIEEKRN